MARKEFMFKGKSADELKELSVDEVSLLLPSKERRKIRRGFSNSEKSLLKKLAKRDKVKTQMRQMIILPAMFGKTILIHNGKDYVQVLIQPEMVGKRLGMFSLTRKPVKHSAAGVTKTKETK